MRASRLVSELLLLQARGRMTAQQLADELEVSVRTVYRDVESLAASGVPVYGEPGPDGGYRLVAGYRTRLTGLTREEAETLFLAGLPGPAAELGIGAHLGAAERKLMAALPEPLRERAGHTRARFHLDPLGWYNEVEATPHLAPIADAVWRERRIEVRYRRWSAPEQVTRLLDPYGVVLKAGRWYLVAGTDGEPRTYRVGQVIGLTVLEEGFDRPAGFDLAAYWQSYLAGFEARRHHGSAVILVSERGIAALQDPAVRRAALESAGELQADGRRRTTIPIETVEHAAAMLLALGAEVEVLEPPGLRAHLARAVAELAIRYGRPG